MHFWAGNGMGDRAALTVLLDLLIYAPVYLPTATESINQSNPFLKTPPSLLSLQPSPLAATAAAIYVLLYFLSTSTSTSNVGWVGIGTPIFPFCLNLNCSVLSWFSKRQCMVFYCTSLSSLCFLLATGYSTCVFIVSL